MFKRGQRVVVLRAHVGGSNDEGTIVCQGREKEYKDKWWIDLGYTLIPIEEERLRDAESFWKEERERLNKR